MSGKRKPARTLTKRETEELFRRMRANIARVEAENDRLRKMSPNELQRYVGRPANG